MNVSNGFVDLRDQILEQFIVAGLHRNSCEKYRWLVHGQHRLGKLGQTNFFAARSSVKWESSYGERDGELQLNQSDSLIISHSEGVGLLRYQVATG